MKTFTVSLLLLAIPVLCFGRLMNIWTYQELFDQADLVVIGAPTTTEDTKEKGGLPEWTTIDSVGVATGFKVSVVIKGDKALKKFVLHHYRLKDPNKIPENGPNFVSFAPSTNPEQSDRYMLFLKKETDGKYAPVGGQIDPALFSIVKLHGCAR